MSERYLKLEVIWKDEHMFELKVSANNGRYSGITEVYEVSDSLLGFVNELNGFPFGNDKVTHSCGEKDSYAYFEMEFYKIGLTGKCGLQITMEENVATEYRKEEKDKLTMELIVEPNSIDIFCRELKVLADSIMNVFTWDYTTHKKTIWVGQTKAMKYEIIDAIRYKNGVRF